MHCDDKRTIAALKQYISDVTCELDDLSKHLEVKHNDAHKIEIQNRINTLKTSLRDSKDQLLEMI